MSHSPLPWRENSADDLVDANGHIVSKDMSGTDRAKVLKMQNQLAAIREIIEPRVALLSTIAIRRILGLPDQPETKGTIAGERIRATMNHATRDERDRLRIRAFDVLTIERTDSQRDAHPTLGMYARLQGVA